MSDQQDQGNHQQQDWSPAMATDMPAERGRAFPIWIWGCGGGCLLTLVLVFGALFWIGNKVYSSIGPEAAWPRVAELMPWSDDVEGELVPPTGYQAIVIDLETIQGLIEWVPGAAPEDIPDMPIERILTITQVGPDEEIGDYYATIYVLPPGELTDEDLGEVRSLADEWTTGTSEAPTIETVEISFQTRTLEAVRYAGMPNAMAQMQETTGPVQVLELDLTNGRANPVVLQFSGPDQPSVEELEAFFAPFDVWGNR